MAHNQPPVVFVNMAQCWQCGRYILPGDDLRRRVLQTGVAYKRDPSGGRVDQYGPVNLCVACDEAVTEEECVRNERSTRRTRVVLIAIGGLWLTGCLRGMGVPWLLAIATTGALVYSGVLGRIIAAAWVMFYALAWAGIPPTTQPQKALPYFAAMIVGILLLKGIGVLLRKRAAITQRETRDKAPLEGGAL